MKQTVQGRANPVVRIRERMGMNRVEFARATGLGYSAVTRAEDGLTLRLPRPVVDALVGLGEDADAVGREYAEWRKSYLLGSHPLN